MPATLWNGATAHRARGTGQPGERSDRAIEPGTRSFDGDSVLGGQERLLGRRSPVCPGRAGLRGGAIDSRAGARDIDFRVDDGYGPPPDADGRASPQRGRGRGVGRMSFGIKGASGPLARLR